MKTKSHLPLILAALSLLATALISSCNTIHGAGEDVAHAGRAVERAAGN